jgi:hypothetical protein
VLASGVVRAGAGAEFDLAPVEVLFEVGPFGVGDWAVLLSWSLGAATVQKCLVVPYHILVEDSREWSAR